MAYNKQLTGHPAEDLAKLCFSKLRFLSVSLKDKLRAEGLWEDLSQELYRIALEGWRQGLTPREIGGMATRELRTFLQSYGYRRVQGHKGDGFVKLEETLQENLRVNFAPSADAWDSLEEAILSLLRKHPEGLSQCQVNRALHNTARAAIVSHVCARLVVRELIKEVPRPKGNGRPPSPTLQATQGDGRSTFNHA